MSCRVCSSGDELDLLRGCEGWKVRSTEAREPSEETARSMGMPPGGNSSEWNDFSSWLEVEDDWEEQIQMESSPGGTMEPTQIYLWE